MCVCVVGMGACLSLFDSGFRNLTLILRNTFGIQLQQKAEYVGGVTPETLLELILQNDVVVTDDYDLDALTAFTTFTKTEIVEARNLYESLIEQHFAGGALVYRLLTRSGMNVQLVRILCSSIKPHEIVCFPVIITMISIFDKGSAAEKLAMIFSMFDYDGSGALSYEEVLGVLTGITGDSCSEQEIDRVCDDLFDALDANGDGEIQFEEFIEAYPMLSEILQLDVERGEDDDDDDDDDTSEEEHEYQQHLEQQQQSNMMLVVEKEGSGSANLIIPGMESVSFDQDDFKDIRDHSLSPRGAGVIVIGKDDDLPLRMPTLEGIGDHPPLLIKAITGMRNSICLYDGTQSPSHSRRYSISVNTMGELPSLCVEMPNQDGLSPRAANAAVISSLMESHNMDMVSESSGSSEEESPKHLKKDSIVSSVATTQNTSRAGSTCSGTYSMSSMRRVKSVLSGVSRIAKDQSSDMDINLLATRRTTQRTGSSVALLARGMVSQQDIPVIDRAANLARDEHCRSPHSVAVGTPVMELRNGVNCSLEAPQVLGGSLEVSVNTAVKAARLLTDKRKTQLMVGAGLLNKKQGKLKIDTEEELNKCTTSGTLNSLMGLGNMSPTSCASPTLQYTPVVGVSPQASTVASMSPRQSLAEFARLRGLSQSVASPETDSGHLGDTTRSSNETSWQINVS